MKVLVTGAEGFLGRFVVSSLERNGIAVAGVSRRPVQGNRNVEFVSADLLADSGLQRIISKHCATHLIHLAWYTEHGKYWSSRLNFDWVAATVRLVEAFCAAGGRGVVVAGTCAEYEWSGSHCYEAATPLMPRSVYGVAKDATRRLVTALCEQHGLHCAWGRIFFPYGPTQPSDRLVPALIGVFTGVRKPFAVHGEAVRDFVYASDVADGLTTLLLSETHGACNVCSGRPTRIREVVNILAEHFNMDPGLVLDRPVEGDGEPLTIVGDNTILQSLGWRPQMSLAEGLQRTIHYRFTQ